MQKALASRATFVRRFVEAALIPGGAIAAYVVVALLVTMLTQDAIAGAAAANITAFGIALLYRSRAVGLMHGTARPLRSEQALEFWICSLGALLALWVAGQSAAIWAYQTWGSAEFDAVGQTKMDSPIWLVLLTTLILAPVGEEALMRGIAYPQMRKLLPPVTAAFLTAGVFALLHGNLVQIVLTVPLGVLLALIYEVDKRLWPIILMHVLFNAASMITPVPLIAAIATLPVALAAGAVGAVMIAFGVCQRPSRLRAR